MFGRVEDARLTKSEILINRKNQKIAIKEDSFVRLTLEDAKGRFKIELVRLGVLGEGSVGARIRDVFSIGKIPSTGMKYSR